MDATVRQRTLRALTLISLGLVGMLAASGDPLLAFRTPAFLVLAGVAISWTVVENLVLRQDEPKSYRGKLTTRLVQAGVIVAFVVAALDRYRFDALLPRTTAVALAGGAVMVAGAWLRIAAIRTLDGHFRYELRVERGQGLVTRGPYARLRHPSYLGIMLITAGGALAMSSVVGLVVAILWQGATLAVRIPEEEAVLRESFGREYEAYAKRSWRLVPPIW